VREVLGEMDVRQMEIVMGSGSSALEVCAMGCDGDRGGRWVLGVLMGWEMVVLRRDGWGGR